MARRDRTFSDGDVIRIFQNNLTTEEQDRVVCFLCGEHELDSITGDRAADDLLLDLVTIGVGFVPIIGGPAASLLQAMTLVAKAIDTGQSLLSDPVECAKKTLEESPIGDEVLQLLEDLR